MSKLRQISGTACVLIVLLRLSIGWQFIYEGLWKLNTFQTATPWTAAGYLKNSVGPMRDVFRNMTGDPDDLDWLDHDKVVAKWDAWAKRFTSHYQLTDEQQRRLHDLLDGPETFAAVLEKLPDGVEIRGSLGKAVRFDAKRKRLIIPGDWHMLPQERDRLLKLVTVEEKPAPENKAKNDIAKAFQKAVNEAYARAARLSYKDRLLVSLKGDPERAGIINERQKGTIDYKRMGEIEMYREQLKRYEANRAVAVATNLDFHYKHLNRQHGELMEVKNTAVGPVKALDKDLKIEARKLLTIEQLAKGPEPTPLSQQDKIDLAMAWSLTLIGLGLIAGCFTRLASFGAACLLFSFWLSFPPLPGVHGIPGVEHSFIINKNMIECVAMLTLATLPSGRWFGVDALIHRFILRKKDDAPT